jgi:hypothetical protein
MPRYRTLSTLVGLALLGFAPRLAAQRVAVGDPLEDYARMVSLLDSAANPSFAVRPLADSVWDGVLGREGHPWAGLFAREGGRSWSLAPISVRMTTNSAYASGQNDGLMWQGKGINTHFELGATWRQGPLEVTLRPQFAWSSNDSFALATVPAPGRSRYANAWHPNTKDLGSIDLPQRMGPDDYAEASWGESSIRLRSGGWALGASTEHIWWGPTQRNPLIFSNNAPGVAHGVLGTVRPVKVPGGRLELQWIWGGLRNSDWTDSTPVDRTRYVTGLNVAVHPGFMPGLSVGASRTFYMDTPPEGIDFSDLFLVFQGVTKQSQASDSNPGGDDAKDQFLTLFGRYAPPGSGFEAYFEWGRNDHSWDWRDFLAEPEHSAAFTIGAQKALRFSDGRVLRLAGEFTDLQRSLTQLVRAAPSWYVHTTVLDGWTQDGQGLGAPIGTGSTSQALWADLYSRWGRVGLLVNRVARDNDALYSIYAGEIFEDFMSHQVELTVQASALVFWRGLEVEGALGWEKTYNRNFQVLNDVKNLHLELGVRSRMLRWP